MGLYSSQACPLYLCTPLVTGLVVTSAITTAGEEGEGHGTDGGLLRSSPSPIWRRYSSVGLTPFQPTIGSLFAFLRRIFKQSHPLDRTFVEMCAVRIRVGCRRIGGADPSVIEREPRLAGKARRCQARSLPAIISAICQPPAD